MRVGDVVSYKGKAYKVTRDPCNGTFGVSRYGWDGQVYGMERVIERDEAEVVFTECLDCLRLIEPDALRNRCCDCLGESVTELDNVA